MYLLKYDLITSALLSELEGLFVVLQMILVGFNVILKCLQLMMVQRGLRKFLTTSGIHPISYRVLLLSTRWYCFVVTAFSTLVRHGVHKLPNSMVYLLIPGKFVIYL